MKVYVFGNPYTTLDNRAFEASRFLSGSVKDVEFIETEPNKDLPFANFEKPVILDTVSGINKVTVFNEKDLDKISFYPTTTVHDYDLGFQLKYLKKLGKLGKITIIGIPQKGKILKADYLRIQSILRKLVAHDIHGS